MVSEKETRKRRRRVSESYEGMGIRILSYGVAPPLLSVSWSINVDGVVYFVVIQPFSAEDSGGVIANGEKTAELSKNAES